MGCTLSHSFEDSNAIPTKTGNIWQEGVRTSFIYVLVYWNGLCQSMRLDNSAAAEPVPAKEFEMYESLSSNSLRWIYIT